MDHHELALFLHLSRSLHFGRTSRECHVSPSALSRTIQRLEAEVGQPLFARDRRGAALAPAGVLLQSYAAETLSRFQALKERARGDGARLSGTISVFASVTACQSFLPSALSGFRKRYPEIHIRLETGYAADAFGMLSRELVDVAVAALPERTPAGLVSHTLLVTPLVFVAPVSDSEVSRLVSERAIPWERVPLVLPAQGLGRTAADRHFKRRRIKPPVYGEVTGNEAILSLVSLGCGVGVVPKVVMDKSPLRVLLREIAVEPSLGMLSVGPCVEQRKMKLPVVRAFWDSIRDAGPDYGAPGRREADIRATPPEKPRNRRSTREASGR
jgi:LysR family positive regulator for ilvC